MISVRPCSAVASKLVVASGWKPSCTSATMSEMKWSAAAGLAAAAWALSLGSEGWSGMGGMNLVCVPLAVTFPVRLLRMSTCWMVNESAQTGIGDAQTKL